MKIQNTVCGTITGTVVETLELSKEKHYKIVLTEDQRFYNAWWDEAIQYYKDDEIYLPVLTTTIVET